MTSRPNLPPRKTVIRIETPIERLIASAVLAGAYRVLAREMPAGRRGLLKMADKHSGIVAETCAEIRAGGSI